MQQPLVFPARNSKGKRRALRKAIESTQIRQVTVSLAKSAYQILLLNYFTILHFLKSIVDIQIYNVNSSKGGTDYNLQTITFKFFSNNVVF